MEYSTNKQFLKVALERSQKFHIIKYKSLLGRLISLNNDDYFENSTQNFLEFQTKIKSHDLVEHCSDFFWSMVHRLSNSLSNYDKAEIEKTYTYFLLNSFDSFYSLLPPNSEIKIAKAENGEIIFPQLKLTLKAYSDSKFCIRKISDMVLEYQLGKFESLKDNKYRINKNEIPPWFQLRRESVCDRIIVLYQKHSNLFEEHYYQNCCENYFLGHLLKTKIEKAFTKIQINNKPLYDKLVSSIDYIIPYGNDLQKKYPNFAIATLKRTIFLSIDLLTEYEIFIAECIIHEYSHCELHLVQDTILLTNIENNILENYSPWRIDPRPLLGIIHAIYISHEIIIFYDAYLTNDNANNEEIRLVKEKIEIIIHQILIALKQIKQDQLTDFSKELLSSIYQSTNDISNKFCISAANPPPKITEHKKAWEFVNKHLVIVE